MQDNQQGRLLRVTKITGVLGLLCLLAIALAASTFIKREAGDDPVGITSMSSTEASTEASTASASTAASAQASSLMIPPVTEVVSETYSIEHDGTTLYGVITASQNYRSEQRPLVVFSHGFNGTLEQHEEYAQKLAEEGYIVYRFDFYGGSHNSRSGGTDMLDMSVLTEEADLQAVVDNLAEQDFVDTQSITLLGSSQGGVVSTLYAADYPEHVSNLILFYPAYVLFDDVQETYADLGVSSPDDIPAVITHHNAQLGAIYLQDALDIDIDAKIASVQIPVLIVHGTADPVVPYSYAQEAQKNFPDAELVTVDGGGHWTDSNFNQVAFVAIDSFLESSQ